MATSAATLIQRTRRYVGDYPELDTLAASLSNSVTTVTTTINPASGSYSPNWIIQVGTEAMLVKTSSSAAGSITVLRGAMGTTATSHASGATVLIRPAFLDTEILDALNEGIQACFPLIYRQVAEEFSPTVADTYEYTIPDIPNGDPAVPIPYVFKIEIKEPGDTAYREIRDWRLIRSTYTDPRIKFRRAPVADSILRIYGYAPFPFLTTTASTLDAWWPTQAEYLPSLYAASTLLASGESRRVRVDTGPIDNREQANRVGSSMSAANHLLARFERRLNAAAMPPIERRAVGSF